MYIIACDVNTFAKSLWSAVKQWCLMTFVKVFMSFINCRINQDRTANWKKDFLMDCVFLNNILIQIIRFAYFPVTNSKGKNSFHRHFNGSSEGPSSEGNMLESFSLMNRFCSKRSLSISAVHQPFTFRFVFQE